MGLAISFCAYCDREGFICLGLSPAMNPFVESVEVPTFKFTDRESPNGTITGPVFVCSV